MSDDTTKYIENEAGGVTAVTLEHFEAYLQETTNAGRTYLLHGYKELTAAEAKKRNPQLFSVPDPRVVLTDDELVRAANRKKLLAEIHAEQAESAKE